MSDTEIRSASMHGADAYARASATGASIPVRPVDPTTSRRFSVDDHNAPPSSQTVSRPARIDPAGAGASADAQNNADQGRNHPSAGGSGGSGLLGAFTGFLARMFAQQGGASASASGGSANLSQRAGVDAYNRAAETTQANAAQADGLGDVLDPSLPRLSSGRALDLTV